MRESVKENGKNILLNKLNAVLDEVAEEYGVSKNTVVKLLYDKSCEKKGTEPKEMTLMERAIRGDTLSADILEDYHGVDIGQSGWEDREEKKNAGLTGDYEER